MPESGEQPEMVPESYVDRDSQQLAEIRQSIQDLSRRFNELEFERIERSRMRAEIRALEQTLKESLETVTGQLAEQAERIAALTERAGGESKVLDVLKKMDLRQTELEARLADREGDGPAGERPEGESVAAATARQVEELRAALDNVTLRYSEIGEIKKSQLVLAGRIEALETSQAENGPSAADAVTEQIAGIDRELLALRAELRQAVARIDAIPANSGPGDALQTRPLADELDALSRKHQEDSEHTRAALGSLESKLSESLAELAGLPEQVQLLAAQVETFEQQHRAASGPENDYWSGSALRIDELDRQLSDLQEEWRQAQTRLQLLESRLYGDTPSPHPLDGSGIEQDLHAIRSSLEEIRRFIFALEGKG